MPEIKLTIDGTDYDMNKSGTLSAVDKTPALVFHGVIYEGQAIPKKVKPDYEIQSFRIKSTYATAVVVTDFKIGSDGKYYSDHFRDEGFPADVFINNKCGKTYDIVSVKRLSDGEVFSARDICECENQVYNPIKKFLIIDGVMYAQFDEGYGKNDGCLGINSIQKAKCLLITFDRVPIFKGMKYWGICTLDFTITEYSTNHFLWAPAPYSMFFGSKESAEAHLKKITTAELSYFEIKRCFQVNGNVCEGYQAEVLRKITELFKSKS